MNRDEYPLIPWRSHVSLIKSNCALAKSKGSQSASKRGNLDPWETNWGVSFFRRCSHRLVARSSWKTHQASIYRWRRSYGQFGIPLSIWTQERTYSGNGSNTKSQGWLVRGLECFDALELSRRRLFRLVHATSDGLWFFFWKSRKA